MAHTVRAYEATDHHRLIHFLNQVTTLEEINEDVLKKCVFIERDQSVIAMVSYEVFECVGMIRYFVFDKTVSADMIINLFFRLYFEAKEDGISKLFALVSTSHGRHVFEMLGFVKSPKEWLSKIMDVNKKDMTVLSINLVSENL